jgi:hypothetical protein
MGEIFAAIALGLLIGAAVILAWAVVGAVVAIVRYVATPPPPPPPGADCVLCTQLQALWNSMSWPEKVACLANFVAAAYLCAAIGCGGIALTF